MRLHPPRNRFLRFSVYLICFVLVLLAIDLLWVQWGRTIHPGYETTRIVSPRADDGSVDYLAAIETYFSRGVTNDNNSVPLLLEAMGRAGLPTTQPPDGITDRLGMSHLPVQGDYFIPYATFTKAPPDSEDTDTADLKKPYLWLKPRSPVTLDWLKANEKPLVKVHDAVKRPRYFIPFNGGNRPQMLVSVQIPHMKLLKNAGSALLTRAMARLESGDTDGCREDLLAAHRLARLMAQASTLIERAVAMNMETAACHADRTASSSGKFTSDKLKSWTSELASLGEIRDPFECSNVSERYMFLDALQFLARANPAEAGRIWWGITDYRIAPPWLFHFLPIPYEESMKVANHWHDGYLAAMRLPTYAMRHAALETAEQNANDLAHRGHFGPLSPTWGLGLFLPALDRMQQRWETTRAEDRLTRIAFALTAYHTDHNSYPSGLSDLSGTYLPSLPQDNFTDGPFIYTRTEATYTLHSPGPNLQDDGGGGDDIVANPK